VSIDESVRDASARIVGAIPSEVCVMNSLTINLHLMMVAFYRPTPTKFKIVVEGKAFPSDMHMLQSQVTCFILCESLSIESFLKVYIHVVCHPP